VKKQKALATEKALEIRRRVKAKKPEFIRQESWRYKRLKENWRRPKGIDNKMRRKVKGWPQTVNTGYRGPKATRGLHPSGYQEILVYNVDDLKKVDSKTQAIRIAHTVGKKKRAQIITEARKKRIVILNVKEIKEAKEAEEAVEEEKEIETLEETAKEKLEENKTEEKERAEEKTRKRKPIKKKAEGEQKDDDAA
jgi:large subunit ribosomal protein L32e